MTQWIRDLYEDGVRAPEPMSKSGMMIAYTLSTQEAEMRTLWQAAASAGAD